MDDESIALSKERREVVFRVFWMDGDAWRSKLVSLSDLNWIEGGRANAMRSKPPWHREYLSRWRRALGERGLSWKDCQLLLAELAGKIEIAEIGASDLHDLDVHVLINCLLSLLEGRPIGSRQQNLIEVLNSFLNVERRHRYMRLIRTFARLTNRDEYLKAASVRNKIAKAGMVAQDDRQSISGRIALALFPETFSSAQSDARRAP